MHVSKNNVFLSARIFRKHILRALDRSTGSVVSIPEQDEQGNIDGAYFGSTFPHLLLLNRPALIPTHTGNEYVPKIYGFKIHTSSAYYRGKTRIQTCERRLRLRGKEDLKSSTSPKGRMRSRL